MKGQKHTEWRTQRQLSKKELQLRVGSRQNGPQDDGGNGAQQHTSSTTTYPFVTSPKWFGGFSVWWSEIYLMLNRKLRIYLLSQGPSEIKLPFPQLHTLSPLKQNILRMQRSTNVKPKHRQRAQKHFRYLSYSFPLGSIAYSSINLHYYFFLSFIANQ